MHCINICEHILIHVLLRTRTIGKMLINGSGNFEFNIQEQRQKEFSAQITRRISAHIPSWILCISLITRAVFYKL
jgi:hypothetical protein